MEKFKKDELKKKVIFLGLAIPVAMVVISISYAFFQVSVESEEERLIIRSGDLALTFKDNDETIENTERTWNFGDSIEKELVIENTGTRDIYAKISWDNLINTYLAESLTYTLEEKGDESGAVWKSVETVSPNVPRSETASTQLLADHLLVPSGHTYTYIVRIKFEDLEDIDQTQDINAKFITKFTLEQGKPDIPLLKLIKNAKSVVPNFATPATIDETADGLFSMEDDYGMSYYFRGACENNYVKFGKNAEGQDMWWRIIRVNGDNSIRMQYDGVGDLDANTYTRGFALTKQAWNGTYNDAKYVGWMFGGANGSASTSREQAQRNETDSPMKAKVDEWYKKNIVDTGYGNYVADSIFCNDRSFESRNNGPGYGNRTTYYGARGRTGVNDGPIEPQFMCPLENDKFTVEETSGGNGALTYPVGLITADEILAGGSGKYSTNNNGYFLNKDDRYWSFSPGLMYTSYAAMFVVDSRGGVNWGSIALSSAIAPVINLKAEYLDKLQGNGTIDNPYFLR